MGNALDVTLHFRKLHPKQRLFVRSPLKRKIIRAGRRGGKTVGAAALAAERFLAGHRILYATPTSDQVQAFWRETVRIFGEAVSLGVLKKNETEKFIERPGTTNRIRAKTAWNADTLRGDYADLLILDEWQLMDENAWGEVGAPMLADNNGDAVFIYTPASLRSRSVSKARDKIHAAKMFERAQNDPRWLALHWTSRDNPYISAKALEEIAADMTALSYRQEILAQDIDEIPGALWTRTLIENTRVREIPTVLRRILVGVDPSGSSVTEAGVCGVGIGEDNHLYIMQDSSRRTATPMQWAEAAVNLYRDLKADAIVAETNFGGFLVKSCIASVDADVPIRETFSSRGKIVRASPIAAWFEQGRAHVCGELPELEDEMCSYVEGDKSPNRMDAMVFAATELIENRLGIVDWLKKESGQVQRAALPAAGQRHWTVRRGTDPTPEPVSVEENVKLSRDIFDQRIRWR
jgi:Terminase RNaseH-like domain